MIALFAQDEAEFLRFLQGEFGGNARLVGLQFPRSGEMPGQGRCSEHRSVPIDLNRFRFLAGEVKCRIATKSYFRCPADGMEAAAHKPGWFVHRSAGLHGHEIGQFNDGSMGQETRYEDVGSGQVELIRGDDFRAWCNSEASAALSIENRREQAGRIESRQAEPIEGAVATDQSSVRKSPTIPRSAIGLYPIFSNSVIVAAAQPI